MKYTNQTGGECSTPISYYKPCASDSTALYSFKQCQGTGFTYEQGMYFKTKKTTETLELDISINLLLNDLVTEILRQK